MKFRNAKNRQGITLLFVVSMIVLFLLMGTTFVVISNDYFRAARKRSRAIIYSVDHTALVHRAMHNIVRGPDLLDTNSPLRGHDLLSDQYGYGFKATVFAANPVDVTLVRGQLIQVVLHTRSTEFRSAAQKALDNGRRLMGLRDILNDAAAESGGAAYPDDKSGVLWHEPSSSWRDPDDTVFTTPNSKDYLSGIDTPSFFNGQIMTFTTGPARGVSARIVDYSVTEDTRGAVPVMTRTFVIMPERIAVGQANPFGSAAGINSLGESRDVAGLLVNNPSTVVINGKPFSGFGAGLNTTVSPVAIDADRALRPNTARYASSGYLDLTTGSTQWNSSGGDPFFTQYAVLRNSVNEPHDTYDHDNVFLAQNLPTGPVASFNPVQMAFKHADINESDPTLTPQRVIQHNTHSFRPIYQWDPNYVLAANNLSPATLPSSTANESFPNLWDQTVPGANRPTNNSAFQGVPYAQLGIPHELQTRPLDVDNDQDGVNDSVWVDFGDAIITNSDGRRFKPLVAAMIVDLDSRLNVNAHGSYAHAQSLASFDPASQSATYTPGYMGYADLLGSDSTLDTNPVAAWTMPRGLGWGPAEISLGPLAPTPTTTPGPDYRPLLSGSTDTAFNIVPEIPGRYGDDRLPGNSFFDSSAAFRFLDHPFPGTIGGTFQGRSMDIHGRFATGFPAAFETYTIPDPLTVGSTIDVNVPFGMPVVDVVSTSWPPAGPDSMSDPMNPFPTVPTEIYNSPYEVSLQNSVRQSDDLLYSADELEAVLRTFDVDSEMLGGRLKLYGLGDTTRKHLVTTDSWEVPVLPPTLFSRTDSTGTSQTVNQTIPERLYDILAYGYGGANDAGAGAPLVMPAGVQNEILMRMRGGTQVVLPGPALTPIHSLLAPEVLRGMPMNVNRVFGDGVDSNGNGIVDEHWDSGAHAQNEATVTLNTTPNPDEYFEGYPADRSIGMDHNGDGFIDTEDYYARQIFARHLFVLTWLVAGGELDKTMPISSSNPAPPDMDGDGVSDDEDDDLALLAQWCINVVDFRDADSISTPFKFDKNPWDGWFAGPMESARMLATDPAAYDFTDPIIGVVWGTERPELLLTEALATHERRYEDHDTSDVEYESRFVPKASAFVEIYNPWTSTTFSSNQAAEFYSGGGVDLAGTTDGTATGDPIWRLAFTRQRGDSATDTNARRVYMREPNANVEASPTGNFYHPSTAPAAIVAPNQYAVIGSSGVERATGEFRTTFGRRSNLGPEPILDLELDDTRSITLIPGTGIEVVDGDDGSAMVTETRTCTAIPIDSINRGTADIQARSFGLTDPAAGYTGTTDIDPDGDGNPEDGDGKRFLVPLLVRADDLTEFPDVFEEGLSYADSNNTAGNIRAKYVKLQRLANPIVPFDATFNPYITVDVAPVDLLSFNGLADTDDDISNNPADVEGFDTHERGDMMYATGSFTGAGSTVPWDRTLGTENERYLWPEENVREGMTDVPKEAADLHFFPQQFTETFGALNDTYRGFDAGVSNKPFVWFTWNNRPYVSQYELLNVPLYGNFEVLNQHDDNPEQVAGVGRDLTGTVRTDDSVVKRVFEFLEVPSRFVKMEVGFNPGQTLPFVYGFNGDVAAVRYDTSGNTWATDVSTFNAPNNFVSRYRYPGKINVNTLMANQTAIWTNGIFQNWGVPATSLGAVRGDLALNNLPEDPGGYGSTAVAAPTVIVTDPIRADGAGARDGNLFATANPIDLPALDMTEINTATTRNELSNGELDGSILRSAAGADFFRTSALPHDDTDRNYWFANSSVSKMANVTTDRSSVFAIWITVGYFEVDDQGRLGAEVGADTGEVTRNRGFYIFDRSIPMGFEPGKNHNIERGILVQSIIE